jgi:hypothetical protein
MTANDKSQEFTARSIGHKENNNLSTQNLNNEAVGISKQRSGKYISANGTSMNEQSKRLASGASKQLSSTGNNFGIPNEAFVLSEMNCNRANNQANKGGNYLE